MKDYPLTRSEAIPESRNWADCYCEKIISKINEIKAEIRGDEQLDITVLNDNGIKINAHDFGYRNPNMIIVKGIDHNNNPVEILIPHNRIEIIFTIIKNDKNKPRKVFGFSPADNNNE